MDKQCKKCGRINDVDEGTIFYTCSICKTDEPQPDQSRLLMKKELIKLHRGIISDDDRGDTCLGCMKLTCKAQRDLTASIKDVEYVDVIADMYLVGIKRGKTESKERIEALIDWGDEECTEHSVEIRKNLHKTLEELDAEKPWFPRHSCDECWQELKAT